MHRLNFNGIFGGPKRFNKRKYLGDMTFFLVRQLLLIHLLLKITILTLSVLPERPVIVPSLGSATVVMFTSPLPVVSMISMIFGFPSVVTWDTGGSVKESTTHQNLRYVKIHAD